MRLLFAAFLGAILLCAVNTAAEQSKISDKTARVSYSLGYQVGQDLKRQGSEIQPNVMRRGILDGLSGRAPLLNSKEMQQLLSTLKKRIVAAQEEEEQRLKNQHYEDDRKFLVENAKKERVVSLPSGLQYEVLREGTGKSPDLNDKVTVQYRGPRIISKEFDRSQRKAKNAKYHVKKVIPGMTQALKLMKEGAIWRLFIPPDLAYDERGPLKGRAIIFELELISVESGE